MATNLELDPALINEAQRLGKHKTKKQAVTTALEEYVRRIRQQRIVSNFGTIDFDPKYDHKRARRAR